MPRSLEPNQRFPIVLECDKEKSPTPQFWFMSLTRGEYKRIRDEITATEGLDAIDALFAFLKRVVVGWDNLTRTDGTEVVFGESSLEDVLTNGEAAELFDRYTFGAEEKKRYA